MLKKILLSISLIVFFSGCNLFNQHAQMMDAMRGAIDETSRRLGDQSIGQYAAGAQVIDPGIEIEAGMKYYASARYKGVAGQITASAQGQLSRTLPPEAIAELGSIYTNSSLSDAERSARLERFVDKWLASNNSTTKPTPGTKP